MSETTIINSKAMQTLLAQSENRLGDKTASSGATGPSFHQLLENTVSDDAHALTSPANLASSAIASHAPTGSSGERFTRTLATVTPARRLGPSLQASTHAAKAPVANAGNTADATRGARQADVIDAKKAGLPGADAGDDSPSLDFTQTKVVNAPALPEPPPSVVRASALLTQSRSQPEGAARATTSPGSQQAGVAGSASPTSVAGPRGFASVLASAHVAASTPASLVDQAGLDPSLHMTVTPQAAHLSLDTGATGALTAQLQITNGVADVHLTGEAAAVLARHGAELSLGLTAAGLQPGRLEISAPASSAEMHSATSDGSGGGVFSGDQASRDDAQSQGEQTPARNAKPATAALSTLSGRTSHVHVKA